jgi:hypothetical protein
MNNYTTTTAGTLSVTIPAPPTVTVGPGLVNFTGTVWDNAIGSYVDNYQITLESFMIEMHVSAIVQREMAIARKKYPSVDWNRIQDMLNSEDHEMKELGLTTIREYTKYLERIFRAIVYHDQLTLSHIVNEYILKNRINITEEVI